MKPVSALACLLPLLALPFAAASPVDTREYPLFAAPRPLNRIVEDPWLGATWLGSNVGLILLVPGSTPQQISFRQGLPGMNVYDIAVTAERVWVATDGGPAVYDKADGSVHPVAGPDGKQLITASRAIFAEPDAVWVGTNELGLFRIDPQTLRAEVANNPVNGSRFAHPVLGIGVDGPEFYVSATGYGLVEWNRATGHAERYAIHLLYKEAPIYGRLLVASERVWVGTAGDGVVYLDRASKEMGEYASPRSVNAPGVAAIAQVGDETWFATVAGVSRRDGATNTWRYWQNMPWGYANDVALVNGNIFAAMTRGNLIVYDRSSDRWLNTDWWTPQTSPGYNSVQGCDVMEGKLLFGTGGGGAVLYDPLLNQWQKVATPGGKPQDILVWSTAQDGERTWFATHHGPSLWDRSRDTWNHFRTDEGRRAGYAADAVKQIVPTEDGAWFATTSTLPPRIYGLGWQEGRLAHWNEATGAWTYYQKEQGLADNNVTRIALSSGKLWIGMTPGGLDILDLASQRVTHLYPLDATQDSVEAILIQEGTVWLGTHRGLWKVNAETYEISPVLGAPATPVMSLAWVDGTLWVGTAGSGIYSLDPATGTQKEYKSGGLVDIWAYCMVAWDGLLYVGTGSGIERLDLATREWLPQMGPEVLAGGNHHLGISIMEPMEGAVVEPGSALRVRGDAQASPATQNFVHVRIGNGPWYVMQNGISPWEGTLPLGNATGPTVVNARLMVDGIVRAQTARTIQVGDPNAAAVEVLHAPILQATERERVQFRVSVRGEYAAQVAGAVLLTLPGDKEALRLPLDPAGNGTFLASTPPLTPVGEAHYTIEVTWPGGRRLLPDPYEGYGPAYLLSIRPAGALRAFAANPVCPSTLSPGASGTVSMVLQNTGSALANMSVLISGPASTWATVPETKEVAAGTSWDVSIPLEVPSGAGGGAYTLETTVLAQGETLDHFSCTIRVSSGFFGIPGVELPLLCFALGLMAVARRRHRRDP